MNTLRLFASVVLFAVLTGAAIAQRPPVVEAEPAPTPAVPSAAPASAPLIVPVPGALFEKKDAGKAAAASASKPVAAPPLSPRFQQVRTRIEALFQHRNETPPPFDPRANPFRGAGGTVATGVGNTPGSAVVMGPPPVPVSPEMQLLQQAAAALKVAGVIQINGRDHLIINQAPYKEGDVIIGRAKGQPVYLRLKAIARFTFTLTYNDAELAVKY